MRRAVTMLAVSETVAWGALYYSFGVLLAPFASSLGVSESVVAGAFSLALLASAATASIAGASLDRWGPRPVMTVSALFGATALLALADVKTIHGFYIAWAVIGMSQAGTLYEPAFAAIAKWFPAPVERSRALLVVTSFAGFASTIFVPLTAMLLEHFERRGAVMLLALFVAAVVLPLNLALPRVKERSRTCARRAPRAGLSPIAPLAVVFSLHAFASAGLGVHLVSYLRERGFGLSTAATITGLMGAAQVPARLFFRPFQRLLPARARLPVLLGVQALAFFGLLTPSGGIAMLAALLLGTANGLLTLERAVVVADSFGSDSYGTANGRISTFAHAARAAAPVSLGLVRDAFSSYRPAFLILGLFTLLAGALACRRYALS